MPSPLRDILDRHAATIAQLAEGRGRPDREAMQALIDDAIAWRPERRDLRELASADDEARVAVVIAFAMPIIMLEPLATAHLADALGIDMATMGMTVATGRLVASMLRGDEAPASIDEDPPSSAPGQESTAAVAAGAPEAPGQESTAAVAAGAPEATGTTEAPSPSEHPSGATSPATSRSPGTSEGSEGP